MGETGTTTQKREGMETLRIHLYEPGKSDPVKKIAIPLAALHVSYQLLPKKTKDSLVREGIDLTGLAELVGKKGPRGPLIEIERAEERLVILVE